jgi:ribonuclease P protein component
MRSFASLRRRAEFAALRRRGRLRSRPTLLVYALAGQPGRRSCAGISVDSRVGKAVVRNLVRRRIASILHEALSGKASARVLVVARPAAASADYGRLRGDLRGALEEA